MPIGFLITVLVITAVALLALRPPLPRVSRPWNLRFAMTYLINEQPFLGLYWLAASTGPTILSGGLHGWGAGLGVALVAVAATALVLLAARAARARPALTAALQAELGELGAGRGRAVRTPWARILLLPFVARRSEVRRVRSISYGGDRAQRFDLYVGRTPPQRAPVLIYLHGGAFRFGSKTIGARPLMYRLASRGWVCINANYRLQPRAGYADQLADAKRVVAWVRQHGASYGADPSTLFLCGGSAGAHLSAMVALTGPDSREAGTDSLEESIAGVIACYGYYGPADSRDPGSSPLLALRRQAPPFLIIHGALDTLVPAREARQFGTELRRVSDQPVVYAELPGTQHNFDMFHSLRYHAVCDAIEDFTGWVRAQTRVDGSGQASA